VLSILGQAKWLKGLLPAEVAKRENPDSRRKAYLGQPSLDIGQGLRKKKN